MGLYGHDQMRGDALDHSRSRRSLIRRGNGSSIGKGENRDQPTEGKKRGQTKKRAHIASLTIVRTARFPDRRPARPAVRRDRLDPGQVGPVGGEIRVESSPVPRPAGVARPAHSVQPVQPASPPGRSGCRPSRVPGRGRGARVGARPPDPPVGSGRAAGRPGDDRHPGRIGRPDAGAGICPLRAPAHSAPVAEALPSGRLVRGLLRPGELPLFVSLLHALDDGSGSLTDIERSAVHQVIEPFGEGRR